MYHTKTSFTVDLEFKCHRTSCNYFFLIFKMYFFLAVLGLRCCMCLPLVAATGGCSHNAVCGPLIAKASFVAERRFWSTASVVAVKGLSCSPACWIFLDQGSNLRLLHRLPWQADSLPLSHQGSPRLVFLLARSDNSCHSRINNDHFYQVHYFACSFCQGLRGRCLL